MASYFGLIILKLCPYIMILIAEVNAMLRALLAAICNKRLNGVQTSDLSRSSGFPGGAAGRGRLRMRVFVCGAVKGLHLSYFIIFGKPC